MADLMTPVIRSCDLGHTSKWAIKKPAIADGVVIRFVVPGDESARFCCPAFPGWVLYGFQPVGIRLPDCLTRSGSTLLYPR